MKWVKMPGEPRSVDEELKFLLKDTDSRAYPKPDREREKRIREFRQKVDGLCNRDYDGAFKEKNREWARHEFTGYFESEAHYKLFRLKYETFVGGYLCFYDSIVRNQSIDHGIRFDWKHIKDERYAVTIFMDPPANPRLSPKLKTSSKVKSTEAAPLSDDEGFSVDPPKPPPPPPPAM